MGSERVIAKAGNVVVPSGVRHRFAKRGDEEAHVGVEVRPALRMNKLSRLRPCSLGGREQAAQNRDGWHEREHLGAAARPWRSERLDTEGRHDRGSSNAVV
jgi:hypothetical protein